MRTRLTHLRNTISTTWSQDPAARGAAKMTAGAVLVAEGIFGVLRRTMGRVTGRGGSRASGLKAQLIGVLMGAVFMAVGMFMAPGDLDDAVESTGTVTENIRSTSGGGNTFTSVIAYEVDRESYEFRGNVATNRPPAVGSEVPIVYSEASPSEARRDGGIDGYFHWMFIGPGLLLLLSSLFGAAISVALIAVGIKLFRDGRRERADLEQSASWWTDMMKFVASARAGDVEVEQTAAGQPDTQGGTFSPTQAGGLFGMLGGAVTGYTGGQPGGVTGQPFGGHQPQAYAPQHAAPEPQPAPQVQPSGPPPGWYQDPGGSTSQRWWDGVAWGEHLQ